MKTSDSSLFDFLQKKAKALKMKGGEGRAAAIIDSLPSLQLELQESQRGREEVRRFASLASEALAGRGNFKYLRSYIDQCSRFAERGRLDGFASACSMRSCLKILDEEFLDWSIPDTPEYKYIFDEDILYIDEMLEEVSDDAPPVREADIPDWVDDSHWWWRAPKKQNMTEEERYSRIYYEEIGLLE